jgi:undecaprenyl-diphosphatase
MPPWLDASRVRSVELDRRGALALHRAAARPALLRLLVACSRLGDGALWVSLLLVLPMVDPVGGWQRSGLVLLLGAINVFINSSLKRCLRRHRPFEQCDGIRACTRVPDPFSFPSGHTLHAVAYAVLLSAFYPLLTPLWAGFAALVAVSRVALGLHYPSDVLVGAGIGACTASLLLLLQ